MVNERLYQIIVKLTFLYKICALIWSSNFFCLICFLMYPSFDLAVYEGTVRTRFKVVL